MMRNIDRFSGIAAAAGILLLAACGAEETTTPLPLDPAPSVVDVAITPAAATLPYLGASVQLQASLRNSLGRPVTAPRLFWLSLDTAIARVDSTGLVTGKGVGSAKVTVQFLDLADTATVTVARIPVALQVSADTVLFTELGSVVALRAKAWDGSGELIPAPPFAWSSSVSGVASVASTGDVTSVSDGTALISVTLDTLRRTTSVRVASRPASMTVTPTSIALDGITDTARVVSVVRNAAGAPMYPVQPTYTASDTAVIKVDHVGFLFARKAGTATVTVKADTLTRTIPVTVTQTLQSVRIVPDTATVTQGGTKTYAVLLKDRFGYAVAGATATWSSSNPAVALVDATGKVTAVSPGTATITATSGALSDTAQVTVVAPPVP